MDAGGRFVERVEVVERCGKGEDCHCLADDTVKSGSTVYCLLSESFTIKEGVTPDEVVNTVTGVQRRRKSVMVMLMVILIVRVRVRVSTRL